MIVFACAEFGKKIVLVVRNSERETEESTWHTRVGGVGTPASSWSASPKKTFVRYELYILVLLRNIGVLNLTTWHIRL